MGPFVTGEEWLCVFLLWKAIYKSARVAGSVCLLHEYMRSVQLCMRAVVYRSLRYTCVVNVSHYIFLQVCYVLLCVLGLCLCHCVPYGGQRITLAVGSLLLPWDVMIQLRYSDFPRRAFTHEPPHPPLCSS